MAIEGGFKRNGVAVDGVEHVVWGLEGRCPLGSKAGTCRQVALVAIAVDIISGKGVDHGEGWIRILVVRTDVSVHGSCSSRRCPGVGGRRNWENSAVIVGDAGSERSLSQS